MSREESQKKLTDLQEAVAEKTGLTPKQSEKVILAILRNGFALTHLETNESFAINPEAPDDDDLRVVDEPKEVADESVEPSDDGGDDKDVQGE